ncbi:hypothetical protein [Microbacterium sp.]|uniref:hypothetical protein n=1 Tax=Microbacterium sp. TaxID=51671 RepID=UPI0039E46201
MRQSESSGRGEASTERVFRVPLWRVLLTGLVSTCALWVVVLVAGRNFLPRTWPQQTRALVLVAGLVVALLAAAFAVLWMRNLSVHVTAARVEVRRPWLTIRSWDRARTAFGSQVTAHYSNGFRSATTRELVAVVGDRSERIVLPGFSRSDFNDLLAVLQSPEPADPAGSPVDRGDLAFRIDSAASRTRVRRLVIAGAVAAVAGIAGGVAGMMLPDLIDLLVALGLLIIALAGLGALVAGLASAAVLRRVSREIVVGAQQLRVDDAPFAYTGLERIWLSPPGRQGPELRIVPRQGSSRRFALGAPGTTITPEYALLAEALDRRAGAADARLVAFDRG